MNRCLATLGYTRICHQGLKNGVLTAAWCLQQQAHGILVSTSPYNTVHQCLLNDEIIYIKHYTAAGKGLRRYVGLSRVFREWQNLSLFASWGIAVPPVDLFCESRGWFSAYQGLLVTHGVNHAQSLAQLRKEKAKVLAEKSWRNQVFTQICHILQNLHQRHFYHGDFKWRNILITVDSVNPNIYLIDCPQGHKVNRFLWSRRRRKDLANMDLDAAKCLSASERLRWFLYYHQAKRLTPELKKEIYHILNVNRKRRKNKKNLSI